LLQVRVAALTEALQVLARSLEDRPTAEPGDGPPPTPPGEQMNCCPPRSPGREEEPSGHGTAMQANPGEHAQHDLELLAREPCRAVDTDSAAGPRPWPVPAAQHPVPRRRRCPHPAISAGPAWTGRLASGQSGRRAGIRRLASEHRAPVATAVDDQRVTGPSAQRAGRTRWRVLARRTGPHQRYHTTSTSSAASESGAYRGSRKPD